MADKSVKIKMTEEKKTPNTVRYSASDDAAPIKTLYVTNSGVEALGNPGAIEVEVKSA